jgi:cell division septum initiation protein DivIVA
MLAKAGQLRDKAGQDAAEAERLTSEAQAEAERIVREARDHSAARRLLTMTTDRARMGWKGTTR